MRTILYISCSPRGSQSISRSFGDEVVSRLHELHPDATIEHRDLAANPPPVVDAAFCAAILEPGGHEAAFRESERLIEELDRADAVVIATPMHNYTAPAVLKAWIDQIVRIRRTFASTPSGKVGLLRDRPVFIVVSSGGWFSRSSPAGEPPQPDFLTLYLRAVLNTVGLRDIRAVTLEGVTRGPDALGRAVASGRAVLDRLVSEGPALTAPR